MAYELIGTSDYLRSHEAFLIQVDLRDYLIDYYHHRRDVPTTPEHDENLKQLITCFAIHLTSRTTMEDHAWTLHLVGEKPYSLFVTGNTGAIGNEGVAEGFLVGHILTEYIRHADTNALHTQVSARGKAYKSYVRCEASEVPAMVEEFYRQSEQRPIRLKLSENSDTAIGLVALPGFNEEWFRSVDLETLVQSTAEVDRARMRTCKFKFHCECSAETLIPFFRSLGEEAIADLYQNDSELLITCPRCGRQFSVARSAVLADETSN